MRVIALVLAGIASTSSVQAETFVVTPVMAYGWTGATQVTATQALVNGNAPMGFGTGSLQATTGSGIVPPAPAPTGGKTWFSTNMHNNVNLSDITEFSYQTFVSNASAAAAHLTVTVQLQVDLDGNGTRDTTMVFEPVYSVTTQGAVVKGQWQSWDLDAGTWWFTTDTVFGGAFNSFVPWANVVAAYPNAKIVQWFAGHPAGSGVQLVAGQNSYGPPWTNFDGNADALIINTAAASVTYDFELYSAPQTKDDCKKGGWMTFNPPPPHGPFKNQGDCVSYFNKQ